MQSWTRRYDDGNPHDEAIIDVEAVSRPSKIVYGSNNENVDSEKLLLNVLCKEKNCKNNSIKVLTICGGGDNYMSLLAEPCVQSVLCVDMNPFQLALGQLKLAIACSELTTEQALGFLGMNESVDRLKVYEQVLEPALPTHVSDLIREHLMHEIRTGIVLFGSEANMFRHLLRILAEKGFNKDALWNGTVDLKALERVCRQGIGTPEELAKAGFLEEDLPDTYKEKWSSVCFPRACMAIYSFVADSRCKSFMTAMTFLGKYSEDTLPEWLLPRVRDVIRSKRNHVTFVNSPISEVPVEGTRFDLVTTSNIFDWLDLETAAATLSDLAEKTLAPDGYLLLRLGFSDTESLLQRVPNLRVCDKVRPEHILGVERSLMFRNLDGLVALRHSTSTS